MKNRKMFFAVLIVLVLCVCGSGIFAGLYKAKNGKNSSKQEAVKAIKEYCSKNMKELPDDVGEFYFRNNLWDNEIESAEPDGDEKYVITSQYYDISKMLNSKEWLGLLSEEKFSNVEQVVILYIVEMLNSENAANYEKEMLELYKAEDSELCLAAKQSLVRQSLTVSSHNTEWDDIALEYFDKMDSCEELLYYYYYLCYQETENIRGKLLDVTSKWIENEEDYSDDKLYVAALIQLEKQDNPSEETVNECYHIFEKISDKLLEEENDYDFHLMILNNVAALTDGHNIKFFNRLFDKCIQKSDDYSQTILTDSINYMPNLVYSMNEYFDAELSEEEVNALIKLYNFLVENYNKENNENSFDGIISQDAINVFNQHIDMYKEENPNAKVIDIAVMK